jgi:hypothetical protein
VLSAFGEPETVEAAGLESPYPYLWKLLAQVEDPHLLRAAALLDTNAAPTWLVDWKRGGFADADMRQFEAAIAAQYHPVATICGLFVYLRKGLTRSAPPDLPCGHTALATPIPALLRTGPRL